MRNYVSDLVRWEETKNKLWRFEPALSAKTFYDTAMTVVQK